MRDAAPDHTHNCRRCSETYQCAATDSSRCSYAKRLSHDKVCLYTVASLWWEYWRPSHRFLIHYFRHKPQPGVPGHVARPRGAPKGLVIAWEQDGYVAVGWSYCRDSDVFSKRIGLYIAVAEDQGASSPPMAPREVRNFLFDDKFLAHAARYFGTTG